MLIRLRYFAILRELVGKEYEELELPISATIQDARMALIAQYPSIEQPLQKCRAACNKGFCDETTQLASGDEVVFIPPMSGG